LFSKVANHVLDGCYGPSQSRERRRGQVLDESCSKQGSIGIEHEGDRGFTEWFKAEYAAVEGAVEYPQVMTVSASAGDEPYLRTLAFYTALDFRVLEEMPLLWGSDNPAVLQVAGVTPATSSRARKARRTGRADTVLAFRRVSEAARAPPLTSTFVLKRVEVAGIEPVPVPSRSCWSQP